MNLYKVIEEIEKVDPEVYDRLDGRRQAMKNFTGFAGKIAAVSLPLMFGSMLKKAYGQTTADIIGVLNFALTLEYLESEFYKQGVAASGLIPAADLPGFTTIRDHENTHVSALRTVISSLGGTPVTFTAANFDYTGGKGSGNGAFKGVFTTYAIFLGVSQAFEDTGVRAYKGQAGNLMSNNDVLTAALTIHSIEARHAAHVRLIRRRAGASQKPWITGKDPGGIAGVQAVYDGEEIVVQGTVPIVGSAAVASESFDEPLTKAQVLAIVDPFIKP